MRVDLRAEELNLSGKADVTAIADMCWNSGEVVSSEYSRKHKPPSVLPPLAQNIWRKGCSSQVMAEEVILRRPVIHCRASWMGLTDRDKYRTGAFQHMSYTLLPPPAAAKTTRLPGMKDRRVRAQNQDWAYGNPSFYYKNSSPCDEFYSQPPYQTPVPPPAAAKTTRLPGMKDRRVRAQNQDWAYENPSFYYKNSSPCDEFYSQPPYQTPVPPPAAAKTTRLPGMKDRRVRAQNQDWAYENPPFYYKNSSPCDEFYSQPPYQTPVPPPAAAKTTRLPGMKDQRVRSQNQDWAYENPSFYNKNSSPCDEFYSQPPYQTPVPPPAATRPMEPKKHKAFYDAPGRRATLSTAMAEEQPEDTTTAQIEPRSFRKDKRADSQVKSSATSAIAPTAFVLSLDDREERSQKSFPKNTFKKKTPGEEKKRREKKHKVIPVLSSMELPGRSKEGLDLVFELLHSNEWEKKVEGLKQMQALAEHQPDVLLSVLRKVCIVVITEVKNLRSVISRTAMTTMACLYTHLKCNMDNELIESAGTLLHQAGQVNSFLRNEVKLALGAMVENCSPRKVLDALLAAGFGHKNAVVRASMSLHLEKLAESMGASRVLKANEEFTSMFLNAISKLAFDANQDVRLHARNTLQTLGAHPDCDSMVDKFIRVKERAKIKKIIHE